ncbi:DUF4149 domain-containing protein [Caldimonas tepidiphila]|uniref:DUF4149 domain-containing protein n=1 Tax=Caldimonas tepidiphila TaxID=2315841 RepID=UPI000E5C335B|nr:DUF4149 domain-containing protein [Caldimonas tepidiphila]
MLLRLRCLLAGLWAGLILTLGAVAAPALFALLERSDAGRVAGRYFMIEAYAGLAAGVLLLLIERQLAGRAAEAGAAGSRFSREMLLVLGALFCTVAGYFALQPMMEQARQGQGALSFGQLHGISSALFVLKGALVLALAWRAAPSGAR